MTDDAPALLALTPADLAWILRELTIEIVGACTDDKEDPMRRVTSGRLRRVASALRERDERALSQPLHRVLTTLANQIDQ